VVSVRQCDGVACLQSQYGSMHAAVALYTGIYCRCARIDAATIRVDRHLYSARQGQLRVAGNDRSHSLQSFSVARSTRVMAVLFKLLIACLTYTQLQLTTGVC
jgi:hypothetical protein